MKDSPFIAIYILTAISVFIGRNWLKASIERAVQHRFDEKIDALRTKLRKGEETSKSELRLKETKISLSQLLFLCLEARQLSQITQPITAPNRNRCIMASGNQSPDHTWFTLWISVMSPALANG